MTLFALGFRIFFVLAATSGFFLMFIWQQVRLQGQEFGLLSMAEVIAWHRHEMIFGYAAAVIAGFLLTAVRNWTGKHTPDGPLLAALAGVWLLARISPLAGLDPTAYLLFDLAFWAGLLASLWPALIGSTNRNRVFLVLIALMGVASTLSHLGIFNHDYYLISQKGAYLGLDLVLVVMLILGGRVIPFFIQRGLNQNMQRRSAWVEKQLPWWLGALLLVNFILPYGVISAAFFVALGVVLSINLFTWHQAALWKNSLLWTLYLAYSFIVAGFFLAAFGKLGWASPYMGIHAFAVGGVGLLTLSMMSRVSLGHTGRVLKPAKTTQVALILMALAAFVRTFGASNVAYYISAGLFMLSCLLFLVIYLPILAKPRPDGRAG